MDATFIALIVGCVVMVVSLLGYCKTLFTRALDDARPPGKHGHEPAMDPRPIGLCGEVFYTSWLAIIGLLIMLALETPGALSVRNVLVAVAVIGLWWIMFGAIVWLLRAVVLANARSIAASHPVHSPRSHTAAPGATPAAPVIGSAERPAARRAWRVQFSGFSFLVAYFTMYIFVLIVGAEFPAIERWPVVSSDTRVHLLIVAACLGGAGFLFFWTGVLALILNQGHALRDQDIPKFDVRISPLSWSASYNPPGAYALSRSVRFDFRAADIMAAWKSGAWRREVKWRAMYSLLTGLAMWALAFIDIALFVGSPAVRNFAFAALLATLWNRARAAARQSAEHR